ncbi:MAG: J domain-containing protein [Oscillochloridaceae bacterium umkhey_bin13]
MEEFEHLDYYTLLGVSRSASLDEVKRAYRQQMARFHPDRFANAPPVEQAYAGRRAQRINEAYATLSDLTARTAYSRNLNVTHTKAARAKPPRPTPPPTMPRDHLAELYTQAQAHLEAGRTLQAAATLREIQQINPFYRDSATLLAQLEANNQAKRRPSAPPPPPATGPDRSRRAVIAGGLGALIFAGLGAIGWATRGRAAIATPPEPTLPAAGAGGAPTSPPPTAAPTVAPTSPPPTTAPTVAPTSPPPTTAPTVAPTSPPSTTAPTAAPTSPPPTTAPTAAPTSPPTASVIIEDGPILYAEDLSRGVGWPTVSGRGWSVGPTSEGYQITAIQGAGNIWAFATSPAGSNFLVGVDVSANGGRAGLLLRYSDSGYLAFFVNPEQGSYRLEQRLSGRETVLLEQASDFIARGAQARNRLVAQLNGPALALRLNGLPIGDLRLDNPPPSALYGMVAFATADQVTATFRDLVVRGLA